MIISIEKFIRTGCFGLIEVGEDKNYLVEVLGKPDSDNDMGKNGTIVLYGWYEFYFDTNDILYAIQNDNYDPSDSGTFSFENEKFKVNSWILNSRQNQTIETISEKLDSKKIKHSLIMYYGREVIKTGSGIIIDFDENLAGPNQLIGIRYWPKFTN